MPTVTVPLISVPDAHAMATNITDTYRNLVAIGLHVEATRWPPAVDIASLPRKSLFFSPAQHTKIEEAAQSLSLSFQQTFATLCAAGLAETSAKHDAFNSAFALTTPPPFSGASQEQALFYRNCLTSLRQKRIGMLEGSTGVGKSRAMIMAALTMAKERPDLQKIVITAPTLAVLGHLWSELERLTAEGLAGGVQAGFFPGSQEFIDPGKLQEYLDQSGDKDPAVQLWMGQGGPLIHEAALIRAMSRAPTKMHHMTHDLKALATNLNPQDFVTEDDEDKRLVESREYARKSRILFCTHTMLGLAFRDKWGLFGQPDILIVDEGHLFEQNISRVYSNALSLRMLRFHLYVSKRKTGAGKGSVVSKAVSAVSHCIQQVSALDVGDGQTLCLDAGNKELETLFSDLDAALNKKALSVVKDVKKARFILDNAITAIQGKASTVYLQFSPDRRFPSIISGREDLGKVLGGIWKDITHGAIIASATLYLPDRFGQMKCDYLKSVLALPLSRLDTPSPIVAPWVRNIPHLHVPNAKAAFLLSRPVGKTEQGDMNLWLYNLSLSTAAILRKKQHGGTVILTVAFSHASAIGQRLVELGIPAERIVIQSEKNRFSSAEQQYRALYANGIQPILIAAGAAWTGIDLTDKSVSPDKDRLLSTLILTCAPVGLNRSLSMLKRIEKTSVRPIINESLMMLRQGLGRIVRHPDMQKIDIWMLDGRPWSSWPYMESWQESVKTILDGYPKKKLFVFPPK
ncbi:type IV CRISPR-associated DEAD/DEAH-box helicase Csf4 [Acidithiobacillus ferrooxidans]|nr:MULTISPECIES: type IV CRISPR-associated DEAD/DEAH-box helicase Csf4 [Acidithiobacillus]MBN6744202.1 type IV CRISPR-associated DEAD/DEAH-box helicase Csf4 [Acidithiobacillus sp. MC2.2]MBN6746913.1 type IV CRISPR-associated DEAD/DEAH-box helicase Csf4 [Acidithiobacillus sp. PG05]